MIKFEISADPLPDNFSGTPQEIFQAIMARLTVTSDLETYNDGPDEPAPDSGVWFKNGTELYGWDGLAYVPAVTTETALPQIEAGEIAPDPRKTKYWLKTSGNVVLGLFYYGGVTVGWVSQIYGVANGSVQTRHLKNGGIKTANIADLSVGNDAIFGPISFLKWARGAARRLLRMGAVTPGWDNVTEVWSSGALTFPQVVEYVHGRGKSPQYVRAVLRCLDDSSGNAGWAVGDEVPVELINMTVSALGRGVNIVKGPNRICVPLATTVTIAPKSNLLYADATITASHWEIRFYITHQ